MTKTTKILIVCGVLFVAAAIYADTTTEKKPRDSSSIKHYTTDQGLECVLYDRVRDKQLTCNWEDYNRRRYK